MLNISPKNTLLPHGLFHRRIFPVCRLFSTFGSLRVSPLSNRKPPPRKQKATSRSPVSPSRSAEGKLGYIAENEGEPIISWFEQLSAGAAPRQVSGPEDTFFKEENELLKFLEQEMVDANRDIRQMEDDLPLTIVEPLTKGLNSEQKDTVRKALQERNARDALRTRATKQMIPKFQVGCQISTQKKPYARHLNQNIESSLLRFNEPLPQRKLLQSFTRFKTFVPEAINLIPAATWNLLYRAQTLTAAREDPHWSSRMIDLVDGMRTSGHDLRVDQSFQFIEALRAERRFEEALSERDKLQTLCKDDDAISKELDLVCIRIYTSQGDLRRAEELALAYLASEHDSEPRTLLPIIDAWILKGGEESMKRAWTLYVQLQMLLGPGILAEDFDAVTLSFLSVGQTNLALSVFQDMMQCSLHLQSHSVSLYKGLTSQKSNSNVNPTHALDTTFISKNAITDFPRVLRNKFFFGKMLKRLLNIGQADAAAALVQYMSSIEVCPDAKHLNGIIGAWLRSNGETGAKDAEQMAWALIKKRLAFVKTMPRGRGIALETEKRIGERSIPIPGYLQRRMPGATTETYALLLQLYTRRQDHGAISALQAAFVEGEMAPNSLWLNPLLSMSANAQKHDKVWDQYMASFNHVAKPDIATFACLWTFELQHLNMPAAHRKLCNFPNGRTILREMFSWLRDCRPKELDAARSEFDRLFYEDIIRSLIQDGDLPGAVIAIHVLRDYFGCYPGQSTTVNSVKQIAGLISGPILGRGKRPSRRSKLDVLQRARDSVAGKIFHNLQEERVQRLKDSGISDLERMSDNARRAERLVFLDEYLRKVLQHLEGQEASKRMFEDAAHHIGFPMDYV